ncbi:hypothetical protein CQ016_14835 [Arthrobacter sp. MYb222]|nr:hypothetical protein CQ016_14835 [Arthrobacter sp. MYb222]
MANWRASDFDRISAFSPKLAMLVTAGDEAAAAGLVKAVLRLRTREAIATNAIARYVTPELDCCLDVGIGMQWSSFDLSAIE